MRMPPTAIRGFFFGLALLALVFCLVSPEGAAARAPEAQAPEPPVDAASGETSFPWLALGLFIVMAVGLTWFKGHPKYPKKATGNCCAIVVNEGERPFQIIEDEAPGSPSNS